MLKYWKMLRGYKRQVGAIVMFIMIILPTFGVEIPEELKNNIMMLGTIIFGVGWLDKGAVLISEKLPKKE